jgi:hypothetical protein
MIPSILDLLLMICHYKSTEDANDENPRFVQDATPEKRRKEKPGTFGR